MRQVGTYPLLHEDGLTCLRAAQASRWFRCIRPEHPTYSYDALRGTVSASFVAHQKMPSLRYTQKKQFNVTSSKYPANRSGGGHGQELCDKYGRGGETGARACVVYCVRRKGVSS